jgi:molecular chaperone GrpE
MESEAIGQEAEQAPEAGAAPEVGTPEAGRAPEAADPLAEARARADELLASLQRLKADFDNYRRRVAQEQARWGEAAVAAFVAQLLPAVDNLERAAAATGDAEAVRRGVELTLRQIREVLASVGVEPLEAVGQPFDPERHEAVARGSAPGVAEGTVIEEYRRGYAMRGSVLRPALVKVATPEPSSAGVAAGGSEPAAADGEGGH